MAGINPNLPNLKLQNLQLNSTQKVDAKAPEKTAGDAKTKAVWLTDDLREGLPPAEYKVGDVITNGRAQVEILGFNDDGSPITELCDLDTLINAKERYRGDIRG